LSGQRSEADVVVGNTADGGCLCAGKPPAMILDHTEAVAHFLPVRPLLAGEDCCLAYETIRGSGLILFLIRE
jgi:hypothetical protein